MISAGVDAGALTTKAVVLRDGELCGFAVRPTEDDSRLAAEAALAEALQPLGPVPGELLVCATGAGKSQVPGAREQLSEVVCLARGAGLLHPGCPGLIDLGGESTRVVKLDASGNVLEFALNDKCAAGTGVFLDAIAKVMQLRPEEMGPLSLRSTADLQITTLCVAFVESEVVSLIHRQTPRQDILRGMHRSIATRVYGLVKRIGLEARPGNLAVGGLARNVGIIACLEELLGARLIVPEHPQLFAAAGAALAAAELQRRAA